jgi:hypothetical protein
MIRYLPCHQACFCRKSLFDRYGSFDISYRITADFNWLLKAVSSGSRLQFIDRNVAFFNVNGISSSLSGTFLESARAILRWYGVAGLLCHIFWRGVNVCSFIGCGLFQGCSGNDQVKPEDIPRKAPEL